MDLEHREGLWSLLLIYVQKLDWLPRQFSDSQTWKSIFVDIILAHHFGWI